MTQPGFWDEAERAQNVVQKKKLCVQVVEPMLVNSIPMPCSWRGLAASYLRIHLTTPAPDMAVEASASRNSNLISVPIGLGERLLINMPPRLTLVANLSMKDPTSL